MKDQEVAKTGLVNKRRPYTNGNLAFTQNFKRLQSSLYLATPPRRIQTSNGTITHTEVGHLRTALARDEKQNHPNKLFQKDPSLLEALPCLHMAMAHPCPQDSLCSWVLPMLLAEANTLPLRGLSLRDTWSFFHIHISLPYSSKDLRKLAGLHILK